MLPDDKRVLWLTPLNFSEALKHNLRTLYFPLHKLNYNNFIFISMHKYVKGMVKYKNTKTHEIVPDLSKEKSDEFFHTLSRFITQYDARAVVINDEATLGFFNERGITSLYQCRSSLYYFNDVPCLVLDSVQKLSYAMVPKKKRGIEDDQKDITWYPWAFVQDLGKLKRHLWNSTRWQPAPNIRIAEIVSDVASFATLSQTGIAMGFDIETMGYQHIPCLSFSVLLPSGKCETLVVPIFNPTRPGNLHWSIDDLAEVFYWVKKILANPVPKILQNGPYDASYLWRYGLAINNYWIDTHVLFHSIWIEAPRSLWFICSIILDKYQYWKDDAKGETTDEIDKAQKISGDYQLYLEYNGRDSYNTLMAGLYLAAMLPPHAVINYNKRIQLQLGPAYAASMTGIRVNENTLRNMCVDFRQQADDKLAELRIMTDSQEFNPRSPQQVATLLYDIWGAKSLKGYEKSTDKKILKIIATQNFILRWYIEAIMAYKEAENNISKYQNLPRHGRFYFFLSAASTDTFRFAGKRHNFGIGQNPQNWPPPVRRILIPDVGYIFVEADYKQSDAWYTAGQTGDQAMLDLLRDKTKDAHCVNAAYLYQIPYEKIYAGYKAKEDWVVHSTSGVRQNTKRVVYGAHYWMQGYTLYITMGHEAVMATAEMMGYKYCHNWSLNEIIEFCNKLLDRYWAKYATAHNETKHMIELCLDGHKVFTDCWDQTRIFFGDLRNDPAVQRKFASQIGQAGTSGAINNALIKLYYESNFLSEGGMILLQTHDSILTQIPLTKLHLADTLLECMKQPCTTKWTNFTVPIDATCGFVGDKDLMWPYGESDWQEILPERLTKATVPTPSTHDNGVATWPLPTEFMPTSPVSLTPQPLPKSSTSLLS